jgi:hypothetical protein
MKAVTEQLAEEAALCSTRVGILKAEIKYILIYQPFVLFIKYCLEKAQSIFNAFFGDREDSLDRR